KLTGGSISKLCSLPRLMIPHKDIRETVKRLLESGTRFEGGIFDGKNFVKWLDDRLRKYLRQTDRITFEKLPIPLKIVASNLTTQKVMVFRKQTWPHMPVADAVRASMSIPFFFRPHWSGSEVLVDGGLMSNFPAWVFDEERNSIRIRIPTIGFRLVEGQSSNT